MAEQEGPTLVIRYSPAPPALGANLDAGARVQVDGMDNGPFEGVVVPGEFSDLHDQLPPEAHDALDRAAVAGTAGESGQLGVELGDDLPW